MRTTKRLATKALIMGCALLLIGCGQERQPSLAFKSPIGAVPAEKQRAGDPKAGFLALVNKPYVTCGIPYAAYEKRAEAVDPSRLLPAREGRNAELPYMLTSYVTRDGVELVTSNCLTCHAGFFNDQLIVGLGNEFLDFTGDPVLSAEGAGAYVSGDAREVAEWRKWADRIAAIAPYTMTDTVGVNPANNLTLALFAHRDPRTLAWSSEPLLDPPPTKPLPVSVPPWWRMKKKHAMFYTTEGRGDHARIMMTASALCTDSVEEAQSIDAYFPDIRAFIASLKPPAYPFAIDGARADRGHGVYDEHCSHCHGTYGQAWTYPNLVIGLDEIGTDPEHALAVTRDADRFLHWYNSSFYGELAREAPAPGYIAPPLDGIWATAPYLHNGSVPTIAALLDTAKRPTHWLRTFDATDYDQQGLGWNYTELEYGKEGSKNTKERKQIYDTTLKGYSNTGHTFGDALNDGQRAAVLEYLKTL